MGRKKKTGYVVETQNGKTGKVYHNEKFINNKIVVYSDKYEKPLLCEPTTIKILTYFEE